MRKMTYNMTLATAPHKHYDRATCQQNIRNNQMPLAPTEIQTTLRPPKISQASTASQQTASQRRHWIKIRTNNGVKTSNVTPITALKLHGANHDVHIDDARTTWRQSQQTTKKGSASQRTRTYKVAMIKVDDATRRATQTRKIKRRRTNVLIDDVTIQRRSASTSRRKQNSLP